MEGITSPPMVQGNSSSSFLFPLLISMLGIVVTSIAILAYHFLLVKYCLNRRHAAAAAAAQPTTVAAQPPTGIDEKVLRTIPIITFSIAKRDINNMDPLEECIVCLGELEEEDLVRILPNCNHAFHVGCIDRWLASHTSCPLCRSPIQEHVDTTQFHHPHNSYDSNRDGSNESSAVEGGDGVAAERERPFGLLRHCASLLVAQEVAEAAEEERRSGSRLKRSLSMDQSLVVINVERDNNGLSGSSSSRDGLTRSGSALSHFDRVSSKWLRSLSRLRAGKGSNATILPY